MSRIWLLVGAIAVTLAAWGLLLAAHRPRTASAADTPAEARQRQILDDNIDRPGDPELNAMYAALNTAHFGSALPAVPVRWESQLDDVGALAGRAYVLQGMFGHVGRRATILLNPRLRADAAGLAGALCHEMVHAYLYATGDTTTDHGPAFQRVLARLADEHAFEGLVGTDDEIRSLRVWLDEESARLNDAYEAQRRATDELAAERLDVERAIADLDARIGAANAAGRGWPDQQEIDAVTARRDAYNIHAADTNRQVEMNRSAVDEFNRQVERYNLMVTYPDGLDVSAQRAPRRGGS